MDSKKLAFIAVVLMLVLAACGGDDGTGGDGRSPEASDSSSSASSGDGSSSQDAGSGESSDGDSGGDQDGFVTVEGTTYPFTYDNLGRCNVEVGDGSIVSFGNVIGDSARQVTFTYGLAEDMASSEPLMQVIVMTEGGATQLYYSAVGYSGLDAVGSVDSITKEGSTVRITGQLQRVADQTLVDFEAEATCDQ